MSERWATALWECDKCRARGTMPKLWIRPGEELPAAAARYQRETRERCVDGCRYCIDAEDIRWLRADEVTP
jgi:hypothetical protein